MSPSTLALKLAPLRKAGAILYLIKPPCPTKKNKKCKKKNYHQKIIIYYSRLLFFVARNFISLYEITDFYDVAVNAGFINLRVSIGCVLLLIVHSRRNHVVPSILPAIGG